MSGGSYWKITVETTGQTEQVVGNGDGHAVPPSCKQLGPWLQQCYIHSMHQHVSCMEIICWQPSMTTWMLRAHMQHCMHFNAPSNKLDMQPQ